MVENSRVQGLGFTGSKDTPGQEGPMVVHKMEALDRYRVISQNMGYLFLGVPILRIIVYWDLHWGPLFAEPHTYTLLLRGVHINPMKSPLRMVFHSFFIGFSIIAG